MASHSEEMIPATQAGGKSSTVYKWVILFLFDEDTEFPFSCVSLASLQKTDFPFKIIEGSMDSAMRKEPFPISSLSGGKRFCIFAKIEEGVSSERRTNEIKRLNQTYLDVVATRKSLKDSLDHMIDTESYRWICRATYSLDPKPLRSQRSFNMDNEPTFMADSMDLSELPTQKLPAETDDADDAATGSVQKSSKVYNGGANRIAENEENSTTARQSCQEKSVDTSSDDDQELSKIHKEVVKEMVSTMKESHEPEKKKKKKKKKKKSKSKSGRGRSRSGSGSRSRRKSRHDDSSDSGSDSFLDDIADAIDHTNLDTMADRQLKQLAQLQKELDELRKPATSDDDEEGEEDLFPPSNQEATGRTYTNDKSETNNRDVDPSDGNDEDEDEDDEEDSNGDDGRGCDYENGREMDNSMNHKQIKSCLLAIQQKENELDALNKMKGPDPNDERHHKMEDLVAEIKEAIDELSNLKSFDQLQMEANRAKERSLEVEKKTKVNAYRMEQAECRMRKIEEDEKDRCRKTAEILKDFERKSCNGPFFQSLLAILTNFQGGINSVRRTVKCLNETIKQLTDSVRTVQEDQSRMSEIIDNLATKVDNIGSNIAMGSECIDIDRYIPFRSVACIDSFCSDDDGMLSRRKHALMRRIQSATITVDMSKFVGSLCRILFDPDFMISHKWPLKNIPKNASNVSPLPPVPTALVSILEIILQKLVGMNLLDKKLIGPALYTKIRVKFSNSSKKIPSQQCDVDKRAQCDREQQQPQPQQQQQQQQQQPSAPPPPLPPKPQKQNREIRSAESSDRSKRTKKTKKTTADEVESPCKDIPDYLPPLSPPSSPLKKYVGKGKGVGKGKSSTKMKELEKNIRTSPGSHDAINAPATSPSPSTSRGHKTKGKEKDEFSSESDRVKMFKKYIIELRTKGITQEMLSGKTIVDLIKSCVKKLPFPCPPEEMKRMSDIGYKKIMDYTNSLKETKNMRDNLKRKLSATRSSTIKKRKGSKKSRDTSDDSENSESSE